jgi:hypothetical protein
MPLDLVLKKSWWFALAFTMTAARAALPGGGQLGICRYEMPCHGSQTGRDPIRISRPSLAIEIPLEPPFGTLEGGRQRLVAGFSSKCNPSMILARSGGLAIRTLAGWERSEAGKQHLRNLGVREISAAAAHLAVDLRKELKNIKDDETREFVEESIRCYELALYRAAVVLSWHAAIHTLHKYVLQYQLKAFNAEAARVDDRWKPAKTTDDLGRMKESDFLDRIAALSIVGKGVKEELILCLSDAMPADTLALPKSASIRSHTIWRFCYLTSSECLFSRSCLRFLEGNVKSCVSGRRGWRGPGCGSRG